MEEFYVANTMFALNILRYLEKAYPGQNIFFSPWSLSSTLSMVFLGARGDMEDQMAKVLQLHSVGAHDLTTTRTPESFSGCNFTQQIQRENYPDAILQAQARDKVYASFHESFRSLNSAINRCSGDYSLKTANKLFAEKSAKLKDEYVQLCEKYYSTEPEAVDFLKAAEEARKKINSWVKTETEGEIPSLLPEGSVDGDTKMVLVNALHFKGKWKTPFVKKVDQLYPFRVNSEESKPVWMMYLREKLNFAYLQEFEAKILELPYAKDISMFLLLPDEADDGSPDLALLERDISFDEFNTWISEDTLTEEDVEVYMPAFKLQQRYELKSILRSMGMRDAFDKAKANFSGMSERNDLFLSEVFHEATVDVNEEGTVAAGGTGAVMSGRTGHGGPQFVVDRPFMFFIIEKITKGILFCGRVFSP